MFVINRVINIICINSEKTERTFMSVTKLLSNSLKVGLFAISIILFSNLCAFSQDVSITITPIEKLDDQLCKSEFIAYC